MYMKLSKHSVDYLNWSCNMDRRIMLAEEEEIQDFPIVNSLDITEQNLEDEAFKELESRLK